MFNQTGATNQLACKQAHIWEHTRERQRANFESEAIFREESGDEAKRKRACPDLCKIFISASPERSEISLVEKRERWQNCQSIMFHEKRLDPQGTARSTVSTEQEEQLDACIYYVLAKFQSVSELKFYSKKEPADNCS